MLPLTKKKREKESNLHSFHEDKGKCQYFDCIDPILECEDLFKCTVVHAAYNGSEIALYSMLASRCVLLKALESAVMSRFLYKGKRL